MMHYTERDLERAQHDLEAARIAIEARGIDPSSVEEIADIASSPKHTSHRAVREFMRADFHARWIGQHIDVARRLQAEEVA